MKKITFAFSVLLVAFSSARADTPAVHGMLLFGGTNQDYAYHLPMFHAPHDWQMILKISLKDTPGSKAFEAYKAAELKGEVLFTLEPETMDLEHIASGIKTYFYANLFDGHFEKAGVDLGKVQVAIEQVVYSSKISEQTPPETQSKYLIFGENGVYFSAHLIESKPSFDAILKVSQPYDLITHLCRTRLCADPTAVPIADNKLPLTLIGSTDPKAIPTSSEQLGEVNGAVADIQSVIYVETADLSN